MKKQISTLGLKTDKILRLSKSQAQQAVGGGTPQKPGSFSCRFDC